MMQRQLQTIASQSQAAIDGLARVSTTVAIAQGLASSGRRVDLTGLEAAAGMLCAQVLDLPPLEGAALRPALNELRTRLSTLAAVLGGNLQ